VVIIIFDEIGALPAKTHLYTCKEPCCMLLGMRFPTESEHNVDLQITHVAALPM
jgi:hypothetical protein